VHFILPQATATHPVCHQDNFQSSVAEAALKQKMEADTGGDVLQPAVTITSATWSQYSGDADD
jgi:hypothetical protein